MIQWYESHMRAAQRTEKRAKFIGMAPVNLKRKLAIALHHHAGGVPWQGGMLSTVPLFMRLDSVFREDLLLDLFAKMTPMVYCPHVSIATEGFGQSCLYVICSGCVTVQHNEMVLATLHRGDSFGEDWLLLDAKDPRSEQAPNSLSASPVLAPMHAEHKEHMRYVAVNEVLCMCLSSADFNPVVKTYDESVRAFFAVERARKKLEAKRKSLAAAKGYLDDSDSDGEGSPKVC
jgi:signal-transduction protein with cAMP-binding, CBS, and nucleotidyltransferase domain